ncbi:hypothetical protein D3C73_990600 [compost metagenome]
MLLSQGRYKVFFTTSTVKAKPLFSIEKQKPAQLLLSSFATLIRASVPLTEGIAAVGKFHNNIHSLLLVGCALSSMACLPVQADNGIIIIKRDVQVRNATIPPLVPDPNPTTVNANPSKQVLAQTNELSDGDFAGVASGAGISRLVTQNTNNLGGNISTQNQLSNLPAGRSGNSGSGIANMVNSNVQQGLGALRILTGDR